MLVVSVRAIVFHTASLAASVVIRRSGTASQLQGSQSFQFRSGVANELISSSGRPGKGFGGGCYGSSDCTPGKGFDGHTFHHTGATGHHGQRPHTFRFGGLMHHGLSSARRQLRPIDGKGADGFNGQNGQDGYGASVHNGNVVPHNYTAGHPQMPKAQAGGSEHAAYAGLNGVQHDRTLQHARPLQPMDGKGADGFNGQDGQNGYGASVINGQTVPSSYGASQAWPNEHEAYARLTMNAAHNNARMLEAHAKQREADAQNYERNWWAMRSGLSRSGRWLR